MVEARLLRACAHAGDRTAATTGLRKKIDQRFDKTSFS
jgi:hypothetical protein